MQEVKLEAVNREEKIGRSGKPYTALSIKTGGKWYNGFGKFENKQWKVGDTVLVKLFQEEYNGKMYDKFETVSEIEKLRLQVEALEKRLAALESTNNLPF